MIFFLNLIVNLTRHSNESFQFSHYTIPNFLLVSLDKLRLFLTEIRRFSNIGRMLLMQKARNFFLCCLLVTAISLALFFAKCNIVKTCQQWLALNSIWSKQTSQIACLFLLLLEHFPRQLSQLIQVRTLLRFLSG